MQTPIITLPPLPEPEPVARQIARDITDSIVVESQRVAAEHARIFTKLWSDERATPDEILAQLNDMGVALSTLQFAEMNVAHIAAIATGAGLQMSDLLPESAYEPPRAFVVGESGVTLAPPAEGHDAWGREIQVELEEPEP